MCFSHNSQSIIQGFCYSGYVTYLSSNTPQWVRIVSESQVKKKKKRHQILLELHTEWWHWWGQHKIKWYIQCKLENGLRSQVKHHRKKPFLGWLTCKRGMYCNWKVAFYLLLSKLHSAERTRLDQQQFPYWSGKFLLFSAG